MMWRWVWLRSRITACAVSGMIWLAVAGLAPAVMVGLLTAGVVIVVGWRSGLLVRCRFGARRAASDEAAIVLRALVPVASLRGRSQPSLWVRDRLGCDVRAVDERTLVVSRRLIGWMRAGQIADLVVCELVVSVLALASVQRSRLVAAVQLFCLPWTVLALVARPAGVVARRLRPLAWLCALMAAGDLYWRGEWLAIVLLALVVVATVTTSRFDRAWAVRHQAMADDAVRRNLPQQTSDPMRSNAAGTFEVPPMPTREGGS